MIVRELRCGNFIKASYVLSECDWSFQVIVDLVYDVLVKECRKNFDYLIHIIFEGSKIHFRAVYILLACLIRFLAAQNIHQNRLERLVSIFSSNIKYYNSDPCRRNLSRKNLVKSFGAVSVECLQMVDKSIDADLQQWTDPLCLQTIKGWFVHDSHSSLLFNRFSNNELFEALSKAEKANGRVRWITVFKALQAKQLSEKHQGLLMDYKRRRQNASFDNLLWDCVPTESEKIIKLINTCFNLNDLYNKGV
jgi:hypothetical protein